MLIGIGDELKGEFSTVFIASGLHGDTGFVATFPVLTPGLRKEEALIDERHVATSCEGGEYPDLTVVDFARVAAVLRGNTDRHSTLFGKTGGIDDETGVGAAEKAISVPGDLCTYGGIVPGRTGDEVVAGVVLGACDHAIDSLNIALGRKLKQARDVLASTELKRRPSTGMKVVVKSVEKREKGTGPEELGPSP